jgi:hypothetical protein
MKIYPGLIASDFLEAEGNFWMVWLWETDEDLQRWANRYAIDRMPGQFDNCCGLHAPEITKIDTENQCLGHLHFVKDNWAMDIVAHEMMHGFLHYVRTMIPNFTRALYMHFMDEEEDLLCYPFGEWLDWLYRWLWERNPYPKRGNVVPK